MAGHVKHLHQTAIAFRQTRHCALERMLAFNIGENIFRIGGTVIQQGLGRLITSPVITRFSARDRCKP